MLNGTVEGHLNAQRFYETLGRILGEKYGVKLTPTVRRKDEAKEPDAAERKRPVAV